MNIISELRFYELLATNNIYYVAKGEGAFNHSTVTRWFKKFSLGCKNIDN